MTTYRVHYRTGCKDFTDLALAQAFCRAESARQPHPWYKIGCEGNQHLEYWLAGRER